MKGHHHMRTVITSVVASAACLILSEPILVAGECEPLWSALGTGPGEIVLDFEIFDDGTGPALFACGNFVQADGFFVHRVVKWDGEQWVQVGPDLGASARTLEVFDDGTGPALYVGGSFTKVGGISVDSIAKWDGQSWTPVGTGLNDGVWDLHVFDDGSGPALYAGGRFTQAGSTPASRVARWDGSSWSALGDGVEACVSPNGSCVTFVNDLATFDDGSGASLIVGGWFGLAGGIEASNIAKWDGASWSALGEGSDGAVEGVAVFDDGTGPAIYAGGTFLTSDGVGAANGIGRWTGTSWVALDEGMAGPIYDLTLFDDGTGPAIYIVGFFTQPIGGGEPLNRIAKWNGETWEPLGLGTDGPIYAVLGHDESLFVGGDFSIADDLPAESVAVYRNSLGIWSGVGLGADDAIRVLTEADLGSGETLFVGGDFSTIFGQDIRGIASFDGSQLSALGTGIGGPGSSVYAAVLHDDGTGPALYVGGQFTELNGGPGNFVARWDGSQWSSLGEGTNSTVFALASVDHGDGPVLYAGGQFTQAGGQTANRIARWNGSDWEAVDGGVNGNVRALVAAGSNLVAGGDFTNAGGNGIVGGIDANHIARFNGTSWFRFGDGTNAPVHTLLFNPGDLGTTLFVGGAFDTAGSVSANRIARWSNQSWGTLGAGFDNGLVHGLALLDLGTDFGVGPALTPVAMGTFTLSDGRVVNHIARWDRNEWRAFRQGGTDRVGVTPGSPAFAATDFGDAGRMIVGGEFTDAAGADANRIARWTICADLSIPCSGDTNDDGEVDLADLNAVLANFGQVSDDGDTNGDGTVDLADLNTVLAVFGTECP
jgi:hypothetical protein